MLYHALRAGDVASHIPPCIPTSITNGPALHRAIQVLRQGQCLARYTRADQTQSSQLDSQVC